MINTQSFLEPDANLVWVPTMALRLRESNGDYGGRYLLSTDGEVPRPSVLEQRWVAGNGASEWRPVPWVFD